MNAARARRSNRPNSRRRAKRNQRQGAAAVEFAVVAPVMFLLVFGMIEFGRMVMVMQVMTNASREGARVGILDGATTSDVENKVNNYLSAAKISGATVTVTPDPPSSAAADESVEVLVEVNFDNVTWLPVPWFLGGKQLEAKTVMRRETVQ